MLAVDQSNARNRVLVIVMVLVTALDELLLSLFETKWAHEALAIARNVDVGHVAGVVDPRLALQMVPHLVVVASLSHRLLVQSRLLVAFEHRVVLSYVGARTVQV